MAAGMSNQAETKETFLSFDPARLWQEAQMVEAARRAEKAGRKRWPTPSPL
jgi:hypothetical protein